MKTKEEIQAYQKKWREANKEYIKQYNKVYGQDYYAKNKERLKHVRKDWELNNIDKRNSYSKKWFAKPENKIKIQEYQGSFKTKYPELVSAGLKKHRQSALGRYTSTYAGARKRNLDFNLSLEFFTELVQKNCTYCGGGAGYIGLDRIDNAKGYITENVCSCCTMCNMMKKTLTKEQFLNQVKAIANFNKYP